MHWGVGGGTQGGIGPCVQLEQFAAAAFARFVSNESATPYQTAAYEQPCSHMFTGAMIAHSLLLAQP